jgi:hypothetical protein
VQTPLLSVLKTSTLVKMPPAQRVRPSPYDKFTDASATAVASGFSAAMALGPQPKLKQNDEEGTDWLRSLQKESGLNQGGFLPQGSISGTAHGLGGDDEDLSDDDDGDSEVSEDSLGWR